MTEEIILSGQYKDFKCEDHYILDQASEEDVLYAIAHLSEKIDSAAYKFSGVDTDKIDSFVNSIAKGSGLSSVVSTLESVKPAELKNELLKSASNDKKFLPIAESYFMHYLLNKCDVNYKFSYTMFNSKLVPKKELQKDRVVFVSNYKEWVVVKKLKLEKVQDYEVSAVLSSINHTIVNKMFNLAGVEDEGKVNEFTKGKRKSPVALAEALKGIQETDQKKKSYLVCKVCENLGYKPYSAPHMLVKAYPDVKPPKPKGRFSK